MVEHRERSVSVRNGSFQVAVLEGGSGEPLVYLHGIEGLSGWDSNLDRLAQDHHVYAPYQPGVGNSSGLEALDDLWDLVLFYEELLDSLGLEQVALVGHSYGGMVAAELAAHCAHRVKSLVLISALGLWLDEQPVRDFFIFTPEERAQHYWFDSTSEAAKAELAAPEDPMEKVEANIERTKTMIAVAKFTWPIPERGFKKRAHRIKSPTLIMWGSGDGVSPPIYGQEFQKLIPGSQLQVLEGCGHNPHLECGQEFHSALSGFLKGS